MKSVRNTSAGFSLVELMVVVAIIGILATIAVPQVNKFMAKARQSEAKSNLSTMYSAQKAFKAEYNTYFSGFNQVGYAPEGNLRYRIGFAAGGTGYPALRNNFGYPGLAGEAIFRDSGAYCVSANAACNELQDASGAPFAPQNAARDTFLVTASSAQIGFAGMPDTWTMDASKTLRNTVNGIQ